jgi:hypothetical protein
MFGQLRLTVLDKLLSKLDTTLVMGAGGDSITDKEKQNV